RTRSRPSRPAGRTSVTRSISTTGYKPAELARPGASRVCRRLPRPGSCARLAAGISLTKYLCLADTVLTQRRLGGLSIGPTLARIALWAVGRHPGHPSPVHPGHRQGQAGTDPVPQRMVERRPDPHLPGHDHRPDAV